MSFYTYNQNNSGGRFVFNSNKGISHYVIVEADSVEEADRIAEGIGLYFDGEGDCPCCGDRWYSPYGEGSVNPEVYGEPITKPFGTGLSGKWIDGPEGYVHYKDGTVMGFGEK